MMNIFFTTYGGIATETIHITVNIYLFKHIHIYVFQEKCMLKKQFFTICILILCKQRLFHI